LKGVRFVYAASLALMFLMGCVSVFGQPAGTITQTVYVQTVNFGTGLWMFSQATVTYTCMNPDGSWYPYVAGGVVGPEGSVFTISCARPSTFNPWIHVYGQNGYWFGIADYQGIPSHGGGTAVSLVVVLYWNGYQGRDN
jgi:hypothetical protein